MNSYLPMDFSVRWGFPTIAKAALGVIAGAALVLVAIVAWFVRRGGIRRASD